MVVVVIATSFIFIYYSQKLDFSLPKMVDITIYDRNNNEFLTLNNENKQSYIKLEDIDQDIINAIISIEDKKFYDHKGIDILRIGGALVNNIKSRSNDEGASTITQQYARLLYLSSEKKIKRKLEEVMISMNLESKYSKDQILEGYLNSIYFDHGIYGINDAAKFYFDKTASDVTLAEAAILCAIPKGPYYYSPIRNYERNKERKELIINELYKDGKITLEEKNQALNEEIKFYGKAKVNNSSFAPYYQDIIISELKKLNILDYVQGNKIKVYTSLDLDLNAIILNAIQKYYNPDSNLEIAIYAVNSKTGEVLSVIGGIDYQKSAFNRATMAKRQPGSTIKPFLYYAALNRGFTPITTFNSSKTEFIIDGKVYAPTNFNDIYPNQEVSMAYAIATSDNIYAMKTHLFLGTSVLYNTLLDFGFTTKILNTPSLALGTSEVHLSELTMGYAKLASLGKDLEPIYIKKITDENDNILYENKPNTTQKYSKTNSYILTETMTNTFDNKLRINISATGAPIANMLSKRYAAKTGTTDTDSLIVGYNSEITLGIWTGYDDNSYLENADGKYIKFIWADIMENYVKNRGSGWYTTPEDIIKIKVNPINGMIATEGEYSKELFFNVNNIPWYIFKDDELLVN